MTWLATLRPRRRVAAAAFLLLLVLVVWGSLIRLPAAAPGGQVDKLEHFAAYAALAALGFAALDRRSWLLLTALAALGAGVEALQAAMPMGRTGSFWDLSANVAGTLAAWTVWTLAVRFRPGAPARGESEVERSP